MEIAESSVQTRSKMSMITERKMQIEGEMEKVHCCRFIAAFRPNVTFGMRSTANIDLPSSKNNTLSGLCIFKEGRKYS